MSETELLKNFPPGPLDRYRKQATFDWKKMKIFLDTEEMVILANEVTEKFKKITLCQKPLKTPSVEEQKRIAALRMLTIKSMNLMTPQDYLTNVRKLYTLLRIVFDWDPSVCVKYSIGYEMFTGVLQSLGTERHFDFIEKVLNNEITGCFCLTEISHGTDTKSMMTEARYDPENQEFVLNSPSFEAAKCWAGNLGKTATHCIVYAQLYTPDGVNHGLNSFVAQIRDPLTLNPLPGLIVGDMGDKIGLNGVDNGFIVFNNYRLPRENLLNRTGDVSPEGKYITPFKDPSKKFGVSLGQLSVGRVNIGMVCASYLGKATTIAIRYSAVRKQFGPSEDIELPILEYQLHQWRLLPYLSAAYVFRIFCEYFCPTVAQFQLDNLTGQRKENSAEMGFEIHVVSSSSKPVMGWVTRDGIQECREACGGHGYLKVSEIGDIRNNHDANCTYEGENHVLVQQTSNWLLKYWPAASKGQAIRPTPMNSINYLSDANKILKTKFSATTVKEVTSINNILAAYKWMVCYLLKETSEKVDKYAKQGVDGFTAKNDSQVFYARTLSIVYIEHFMLQKTIDFIESSDDPAIKNVLSKLLSLYGVWSLDKHVSILYQGGYAIGSDAAALFKEGILELCNQVKPEAISLIDAIAPDDFYMMSPLGKSDGEVYKHLQSVLFTTPESMSRPDWWEEYVNWKDIIKSKL